MFKMYVAGYRAGLILESGRGVILPSSSIIIETNRASDLLASGFGLTIGRLAAKLKRVVARFKKRAS